MFRPIFQVYKNLVKFTNTHAFDILFVCFCFYWILELFQEFSNQNTSQISIWPLKLQRTNSISWLQLLWIGDVPRRLILQERRVQRVVWSAAQSPSLKRRNWKKHIQNVRLALSSGISFLLDWYGTRIFL